MISLSFWKGWEKDYRYLWYLLAFLFIASLLLLWYGYMQGADAVIRWQKLQEQQVVETVVHQFRLGPFQLNVPAESYVILEYLNGSSLTPHTTSSYIYLCVIFAAVTMLVSLITTLPKIWFYIAAGLFIVFMVTLRLEVLGIFGLHNQIPSAIVMALYVAPAFYFNRLRPTTPLAYRLLLFTEIGAIVVSLIGFFSAEDLPYFHLVITSFPGALILSLIFIILIAHEIFAAFVFITSQGSSKSLQHLAILSAIYFINVVLTLLHEIGLLKMDFIYIDAFLLLSISAIAGVWGFKNREVLFENIFSFKPVGALLYLTLGTICFATIAHHFWNANDPAILVFRHAIIFSHAAYGLIFLMYILANFGQLLSKNAPVHKVLYAPVHMPYFTYRLAGFISLLAIVFYQGWYNYVYNSYAAFYNTAGDFYELRGNDEYAENFYEKAQSQGFHNHKSNYVLGMRNAFPHSFAKAHEYLENANDRMPTIYSLTNAGNLYVREGELRKGVETYKRHLAIMPGAPSLLNNLGATYAKLRNYDSAVYYLSLAREQKLAKNSSETNFFALAALELIPIDGDSIYQSFDEPTAGTLANVYAQSSALGQKVDITESPLTDSPLDLYTATLLNNYIIYHAKNLDTTFTSKAFRIASDPRNINFSEALKASLAIAYYHQANISKALEILAEQVYLSQSYQGKFNYIMGLWALEQNSPETAASYFKYADTYQYEDAPFYHAISLTEAGNIQEALLAWDSVALRGNDDQKAISLTIKRILSLPSRDAHFLPDAEKYQFCRYRIPVSDSLLFNAVYPTFENDNYKAQALLDFSKKLFYNDHLIPSIRYYTKIAGLKLTDKNLYDEVKFFELRLLAARRDLRGLANQINKGVQFGRERNLEKVYYTALLNEVSADTVNARKNFSILARYNPYFEDGVIAAYEYFNKTGQDKFQAYNILAEAVHVNANSLPLLRAYYDAALNVGLEEYAASTAMKIRELERAR